VISCLQLESGGFGEVLEQVYALERMSGLCRLLHPLSVDFGFMADPKPCHSTTLLLGSAVRVWKHMSPSSSVLSHGASR
jgi:hypothetical protein